MSFQAIGAMLTTETHLALLAKLVTILEKNVKTIINTNGDSLYGSSSQHYV